MRSYQMLLNISHKDLATYKDGPRKAPVATEENVQVMGGLKGLAPRSRDNLIMKSLYA